jgi:hypothetical protein
MHHCWLDRRTGKIVQYSEDTIDLIREGEFEDVPKWQQEEIEDALMVLRALGESGEDDEGDEAKRKALDDAVDLERFVVIEEISSGESFRFMADLTDEVKNPRGAKH